MREEANPRKIQRRALDYGASPAPIAFSDPDIRQSAVSRLAASPTVGCLESSKSVVRLAFLFDTNGGNKISTIPVPPSKSTKAPVLFDTFEAILNHRRPCVSHANNGFFGRCFLTCTARAY